ncbi:MAG: glycosyltransferase family 4 protein [Promethearchaeota archaeon]
MKIGVISHSFLPQIGGKELYIYNMARYLTRKGHEVHVVTSNLSLSYERVKLKGFTVHYLPSISVKIPRSTVYYRVLPTLFSFLQKMDFQILNLQEYSTFSTDVASFFGRLNGIPTVLTIHNPWFISNPLYNMVLKAHQGSIGKMETKLIDAFITVSQSMKDNFIRVFPSTKGRVHLIHNGISLEYYKGLPRVAGEDKKVLFLSRISEDKGVEVLIRAFGILREKHEHLQLLIVGPKTQYQDKMEALVDKLGLSGCVFFRGKVLERAKVNLINEVDCMCLPSFKEACPSTILEAMAMRRPIVASEIPGILEILPSQEYGWLAKKRDVRDLAVQLDDALFNEGAARVKVEKAYDYVKRFDWELISEKIERVFEEVYRGARPTKRK